MSSGHAPGSWESRGPWSSPQVVAAKRQNSAAGLTQAQTMLQLAGLPGRAHQDTRHVPLHQSCPCLSHWPQGWPWAWLFPGLGVTETQPGGRMRPKQGEMTWEG